MSDAPDHNDDRALAGEYALGLLPDAERDAFEARLAAEPKLRALYRLWSEDFARLAEDITPITPPAEVFEKIEARIHGAPDTPGLLSMLRVWFLSGVAVAGLALVLVFGTDMFQRGPQMPASPAYVAEIAAQDRSLVVQAAYDAQSGHLHFQREVGEAHSGRSLELWLIVGENAPVSLGILSGGGHTVLALDDAHRAVLEGAVLAITDEPEGGSPSGAPTGAVLGVGAISNS
ncbi:MAG: anti-sigma factor [Roseovarius sp.]|nr:anti-sigma factor [Roseovarius sp.]